MRRPRPREEVKISLSGSLTLRGSPSLRGSLEHAPKTRLLKADTKKKTFIYAHEPENSQEFFREKELHMLSITGTAFASLKSRVNIVLPGPMNGTSLVFFFKFK